MTTSAEPVDVSVAFDLIDTEIAGETMRLNEACQLVETARIHELTLSVKSRLRGLENFRRAAQDVLCISDRLGVLFGLRKDLEEQCGD